MLIRHSALYVGAKLLPGLLGTLTTAILTHLLPPERYGVYGLSLVIMTLGSTLLFDWIGLAFLRLGAADPARTAGTFNVLFGVTLAVAGAGGLLAVAFAPADRGAVTAGVLMTAGYALFEFRARLPVATLRPGAFLRMSAARGVLVLLAAGGVAAATRDPVATGIATAAATGLAAFTGGRAGAGAAFDRALAGSAIRFGLPLAASLLLSSATNGGTRALVGALGGVDALGLYTAGFVLVQNTLTVLSAGLASAGFSLAVRALERDDAEAARRQLAANGALLLAVLAPAALGMALTADSLAAALVGPGFRSAVAQLTPWLAAAAFLGGLRSHYLDHAFHLGRAMRGQVWVSASTAAVTLGADALLIPRFGPLGAAVAVTFGAATSVLHAALAGRSAFRLPLPTGAALRVAAACAVMAPCVMLVPGTGPAALAEKILIGAAVYGAMAAWLDVAGLRQLLLQRAGWAGRPA